MVSIKIFNKNKYDSKGIIDEKRIKIRNIALKPINILERKNMKSKKLSNEKLSKIRKVVKKIHAKKKRVNGKMYW